MMRISVLLAFILSGLKVLSLPIQPFRLPVSSRSMVKVLRPARVAGRASLSDRHVSAAVRTGYEPTELGNMKAERNQGPIDQKSVLLHSAPGKGFVPMEQSTMEVVGNQESVPKDENPVLSRLKTALKRLDSDSEAYLKSIEYPASLNRDKKRYLYLIYKHTDQVTFENLKQNEIVDSVLGVPLRLLNHIALETLELYRRGALGLHHTDVIRKDEYLKTHLYAKLLYEGLDSKDPRDIEAAKAFVTNWKTYLDESHRLSRRRFII